MKSASLPDLRRLRYFLAVAETASFRQAAQALGMAQPPLSQQIMALEKQLGERLFIRHSRNVELTDAGRVLLAEAEPLLARAAEIPERLRRAAAGRIGTLHLGFTPALAHHPLLPKLLRSFRAEAPEIELRFKEADTDFLCREVTAGRIKAAFIRPPVPAYERLRVDKLVDEPLKLAVPASHRFADGTAVPLTALADEDVVMFERALAPDLYDAIMAACAKAGFSLRVVHHAPQKVSAMMLAAGGAGITIVPASLEGVHGDALRMVAIDGMQPTAEIALATHSGEHSAPPIAFRRLCLAHRDPPDAG